MEESQGDFITVAAEWIAAMWSIVPAETEFWAAIIGALVGAISGGLIAYLGERPVNPVWRGAL